MALVDYPDSEGSDQEAVPIPKAPTKSAPSSSKPAFQKVDRSKPHKIKVNLPALSEHSTKADDIDGDGPPAKKARTAGGMFSSFNALLPAPKRSDQAVSGSVTGNGGAKRAIFAKGISLKTGATPSFSREAAGNGVEDMDTQEGKELHGDQAESASLPNEFAVANESLHEAEGTEVKLVGKPMMFKPLSVARKSQKKTSKSTPPDDSMGKPEDVKLSATQVSKPSEKPGLKSKVTLFSGLHEDNSTSLTVNENNESIMYEEPHQQADEAKRGIVEDLPPDAFGNILSYSSNQSTLAPSSQTLDSIAADLNLSETARRQLFGRRNGRGRQENTPEVKILNFNTDKEYEANEALRAAGEAVQHNPVRAIAPGRHTLKQLVNAASTQADALEESFASGRRNKKEAGSKYGW